MLTKTQRDWAQAQVGEDRVGTLTGMVMSSRDGENEGEKILDLSGEDGAAEFVVSAPDDIITEMQQVETTVRVEGKVASVLFDEENGRVGLEIAGKNGSTVEWVVPKRSQAEISEHATEGSNQSESVKQELDLALNKKVLDLIQSDEGFKNLKQRVLALVESDLEIRSAIRSLIDEVPPVNNYRTTEAEPSA